MQQTPTIQINTKLVTATRRQVIVSVLVGDPPWNADKT